MNIKAFFVDALSSALALNIAQPEDVLRHVTPEVLAQHLPRPLWARLLTACLGAPKVDARLVVETIGIPNLCEHVPPPIIWGCIADVAARSLGKAGDAVAAPMRTTASGRAVLAPPPEANVPSHTPATGAPVSAGPSIPSPGGKEPLSDLISELEQQNAADEPRAAGTGQVRPRSPTATRFRQSNTAAGRPPVAGLGSGARRPQAMATPVPLRSTTGAPAGSRRHGTELTPDPEPETAVQGEWGGKEIAVDDSQLVDWQTDVGTASAITGDDDFSALGNRKR